MFLYVLVTVFSLAVADVSHIISEEHETTTTPQPPPKPYYFAYAAGRFPGHLDRSHVEGSDGSGVVKGTFSYVDPQFRLRKVDYIADRNGFHPILNYSPKPLPDDSPVVAAAKERHYNLYARIANAHAQGVENVLPRETESVARAKAKHYDLYQKIAEEHARIAAEREAILATAEPNTLEDHITDQNNY